MGPPRVLLKLDDGATAVEYGIMVALIAVVILASVFALGQQLGKDFACAEDYIVATPGNPPSTVTC